MDENVKIIFGIVAAVIIAVVTHFVDKRNISRVFKKVVEKLDRRKLFSLDEVHALTHVLARKLVKEKGKKWKPDVIIAISSGGCMIAEFLARSLLGSFDEVIPVLTIPMKVTGSSMSPEGVPRRQVSVDPRLKLLEGKHFEELLDQFIFQENDGGEIEQKGKSVLLVNDILHGGDTMKAASEFLKKRLENKDVNIIHAALIVEEHGDVRWEGNSELFRALSTEESISFVYKSYPGS